MAGTTSQPARTATSVRGLGCRTSLSAAMYLRFSRCGATKSIAGWGVGLSPADLGAPADLFAPAFVDAANLVDQERGRPGHHVGGDNEVAGPANEVESGAGAEYAAFEVVPLDDDLQQLDNADEERDESRKARHREVVENLADGARESPRVGLRHDRPVSCVHERHPRREDERQRDDRNKRHALGRGAGGDREDRHLRRRVEAEAEEKADWIHLPAVPDDAEQAPEDPAEDATRAEVQLEGAAVMSARFQTPVHTDDVDQHEQV